MITHLFANKLTSHRTVVMFNKWSTYSCQSTVAWRMITQYFPFARHFANKLTSHRFACFKHWDYSISIESKESNASVQVHQLIWLLISLLCRCKARSLTSMWFFVQGAEDTSSYQPKRDYKLDLFTVAKVRCGSQKPSIKCYSFAYCLSLFCLAQFSPIKTLQPLGIKISIWTFRLLFKKAINS